MSTKPSKDLIAIPNNNADRDYWVSISTDEFTCVCPVTGQPDFAKIKIEYIPDKKIIELKSLKLYFWSFRNEGIHHEAVTNTIRDDLVRILNPRKLIVTAAFNIRGGIATTVTAEYIQDK